MLVRLFNLIFAAVTVIVVVPLALIFYVADYIVHGNERDDITSKWMKSDKRKRMMEGSGAPHDDMKPPV